MLYAFMKCKIEQKMAVMYIMSLEIVIIIIINKTRKFAAWIHVNWVSVYTCISSIRSHVIHFHICLKKEPLHRGRVFLSLKLLYILM